MNKKKWILISVLALTVAVASLAYGPKFVRGDYSPKHAGYACPLTGEDLPCPNCCPLN